MIAALVIAVIYCCIALVIGWLLTVLVGLIPVPAPIGAILPTLIWVIVIIICLLILLSVVTGGPLPLLLTTGPLP